MIETAVLFTMQQPMYRRRLSSNPAWLTIKAPDVSGAFV